MKEKIIDATNLPCPRPLIMTKKGLTDSAPGESIVVLINNDTSKDNVERFLRDNDVEFSTASENGTYKITAIGKAPVQSGSASGRTVISFSSDIMGRGNEDLGRILIQGFINTIKEIKPLPETIICYNSGVKLAAEGAPSAEGLKELQNLGVDIIVCGTCADFFSIKNKISAGRISNMYEILEKFSSAGRIINP